MLKNTFPYSNNRHVSHIRQLPHILKINLHTKLDDGKDPKSKIDDKTKDELKENIKNELKKDLKFEIGDKTKDELKEKIKNELEKDLKNELKKDLKFELDDKTKNEIKDKIKKEIEDEIDCKRDKNGHDKGGKGEDSFDKDGYDKEGFDKDGRDKDSFDKDGRDKDSFDKDGYNKEGFDKDGRDKDSFDKDGYDKDGYNRKGFDEDGYDRTGFDKDGYNKKGFDKDGKKKGNDDDENGKKKGDDDDENGKKKGDDDDENEVNEMVSITSQEITPDHADATKCGSFSGYYNTYNQVGRQGFSTSELLEAFYPEMYSNHKIAEHLEKGSKVFYGAVNYKFAFSEPFDYSWGNASNMWCKKCSDSPGEIACQGDEIKSFCYPAGYYADKNFNESFFAERTCPNLVKVSGAATIKAKQVAPLILVNSLGEMIDKDGNNTTIYYSSLSPYLKANGHIKDCAGEANCKKFAEIMKKVAWYTNKEVLLKTVSGDLQGANPYYYDNEDNYVSVDTNFV
ncbi:putative sodium/potassium/calcium exchanger [Wolbachia endosymbiont of Bemisia tabaci]|uniref:hypothetical protein n=1 Tax=Wolbachia endosymbiont of Bemisia tabaci TaxID=215173 RepID=UPI001FE800E2|nr:hypothetical protein [Wolbachia endosymbiont of Bemisia tabaci]